MLKLYKHCPIMKIVQSVNLFCNTRFYNQKTGKSYVVYTELVLISITECLQFKCLQTEIENRCFLQYLAQSKLLSVYVTAEEEC